MRTTQDAVKKVLSQQYNCQNTDVRPFMDAATGIVDWIDICDVDNVNSDTQLAKIETWLSAHYYGVSEQLLQSKSEGGASGSFQGQTGKYFEATTFGQMAISLDLSGCLAKKQAELVKGQKFTTQFAHVGTRRANRRTFDERNS